MIKLNEWSPVRAIVVVMIVSAVLQYGLGVTGLTKFGLAFFCACIFEATWQIFFVKSNSNSKP
jgi:hypothetical protein